MNSIDAFSTAHLIKQIGRGKHGARSLTRVDATQLYTAMLDGRVSDLELGAIVLALRIKGESVEELAGFLDAAEASFALLPMPVAHAAPVVIPSYNGARSAANLTALLALLLTRAGVPVLIHGVLNDPGRVTTAEIFQELGLPICTSREQVQQCMAHQLPALIAIDTLAPKLARLLALRRVLGVRNSTHTLVKIMQPFAGPALRLCSYTHPEYLALLSDYFTSAAPLDRGAVLLMRGTEGEAVANAKRAHEIVCIEQHRSRVLVQRKAPVDTLPPLPAQRDAATTARWIEAALSDREPIPAAILQQAAHCVSLASAIGRSTARQ